MTNWLPLDQATLCALAAGCAFSGLLGLMLSAGSGRRSRMRIEVGLLVVASVLGLAGWLGNAGTMVWVPCLGVAAVGLVFLSLRWLARFTQYVMTQPVLLWIGLMLTGLGGLAAQQFSLQNELMPDCSFNCFEMASAEDLPIQVETQWAVTDAGRKVPLFEIPAEQNANVKIDQDVPYLERQHLGLALIRTDDVTYGYNCHGFVFTEGRFWVRGAAVDTILEDNGYRETTSPRPGDVVVYRDVSGQVAHTGVVRTVLAKSVLIESKLGSLGRFIHTSTKHPYTDTTLTYYNTRRNNHVLTGLDGTRRPTTDAIVE